MLAQVVGGAGAGIAGATAPLLAQAVTGSASLAGIGRSAMLALGAGTATALQNRYAAVDLAPERHRARDLSIVVWATTAGTVIGPNLGTPGAWLASAVGLPQLAGGFLIGAASALAAAGVSWAWLRLRSSWPVPLQSRPGPGVSGCARWLLWWPARRPLCSA